MTAREIDLVMDAMLKEDASGVSEEELLAEIEAAIAGVGDGGMEAPVRSRRQRMRLLAWAAVLVASLVAVFMMTRPAGHGPVAGTPASAVATPGAMHPDRGQAMRLRIEDVVAESDQTPTRISFTYRAQGRDQTEEYTMGSTWPAPGSAEGAEFPFLLEELPDGRWGIGVHVGRLVRYLEKAGADPAAVNDSLLVDTNHDGNGKIARPGLPSRPTDPVVVLRDVRDLAAFPDGFACASLLRTYVAAADVAPGDLAKPGGPVRNPLLAVVTPEIGGRVLEAPVDFIDSMDPGAAIAPDAVVGTARATLSGIDPTVRYADVPPVTVRLRDLHPTSTTYMRAFRGDRQGPLTDAIRIPSTEIVLQGSRGRNRTIVVNDLNDHFQKEGPYFLEIVHESPSATEVLCSTMIQVDRTLELKSSFFTSRGGESAPGAQAHRVFGWDRAADDRGFGVRMPGDRERYGQLVDQPWRTPVSAALSTFSVDVDTASYANIRRMLRDGQEIPADAVRLEECVNYFDYDYQAPANGGPFAVHVDMASCPWEETHHLVKIGIKGKEVHPADRPPSNLVFLIDVSGSMNDPRKLPLLVESMKILVEELDERDSVGIVVYAGSAGTLLEPTTVAEQGRGAILGALDNLRAGGSTAGAAGIRGAYELARRHYRKDGVNRVILATDGDFNVGTSSDGELVDLVKEQAVDGVFLSILGFGTGNLNDSMMEAVTNAGNGNYFYIDTGSEARKVFLMNLTGTLVAIAKDVKIQVEFNPGKVAAYRLIGYANRILRDEDFNDDEVDAGDIGAGHTVTALYEIVPAGGTLPTVGGLDPLKYQQPAVPTATGSADWMTVKLRYKAPDGDKSTLLEVPVDGTPTSWKQASPDFLFAAAVSLFAEKLRSSDQIAEATWHQVADLALRGSKMDRHGDRHEFLELVGLAAGLDPDPDDKVIEAPEPVPGRGAAAEAPPAR